MTMDLRVLTGVFVTLFGIAVGMAGGDIQSQDLMEAMQEADFSNGLEGLQSLQQLSTTHRSKPANTSIAANLTSNEEMSLSVQSPSRITVRVTPGTTITVGDGTVQVQGSDEQDAAQLTMDGFTGTVRTKNNLSFNGRAKSVDMKHMSLNYSRAKQVNGGDGIHSVQLNGLQDLQLAFREARGTITTGGTEISVAREQATFEYFRGTLTMQPESGVFSYRLDGHIHRGVLGDGKSQVTIGGT